MDLVPPVMPGQKSTYTPVRKVEATSLYVRTLLVNGARSALLAANRFSTPGGRPLDRLRLWALAIQHRRGLNKATIALANKLARIIWATWRYQRPFDGNWPGSTAACD
jgi:transposase